MRVSINMNETKIVFDIAFGLVFLHTIHVDLRRIAMFPSKLIRCLSTKTKTKSWPRVAIVGVGQLGAAVATNLVRNNVPLTLFDIERDANVPSELADKLKDCEWASSAREAAENAEVVITALPRPGNF